MYIKCILATLLLFLILTTNAVAQESKKERLARYKEMASLPLDSFKVPKYKYLASEQSIEDFVVSYVMYGRLRYSKKHAEEYLDSLYSDTGFTYFLYHAMHYPLSFIKLKNQDLAGIRLDELDGEKLRKKFMDEIIPTEDKRKAEECGRWNGRFEPYFFKYTYDKLNRKILFTYKWKVEGGFRYMINKVYKSWYSFEEKRFLP